MGDEDCKKLAELEGWQPMNTLIGTPLDDGRSVLVYLEEPMFGSRLQVLRTGKIKLVSGSFMFDCGGRKPLCWHPMPDEPTGIDPALLG